MSSSAEKYDVFLSFRGEDTRRDFARHLFEALEKKSIKTYMDTLLDRGEDVWPALEKAIENSQMSIVVFSENYGTSKWCLEELVKILKCRKDHGQVVIPVFYETDPSHIRKQTGTYGKAFAKYEGDLKDEGNESIRQRINNWRSALTEAANISGWDSRTHRDDVQLIGNVVEDIWQKLNMRHPTELKGLVGTTDEICGDVEVYMNKVRVLGIWGMGGIGKTTIARVLFTKLFPQFDNACFVSNVKEYSLDRLLSELLKEKGVGISFGMRRLSSKKVLIVLDDVSSLDQLLEDLCREYRDQSQYSRLIITTRNKHLLEERVDWIYEVKKWNYEASLKLFNLEAFKGRHPPESYADLAKRAVKYAGGIPLALKVLGSSLCSKSTGFWESTLRKLEKHPNKTIVDVLKVSYDGLEDLEKKIFLDIAFFFKGEEKDHVISILDACGFEASSGIYVLEDKALITISSYTNIIGMHDLLQIMAFHIVHQLCSGDPKRCSRLRDIEEVSVVLKDNKGTGAIEGITLDLSQIKDLHLRADTFKKMKNLRLLKVYIPLGQSSGNVHLPGALEPFSGKLRYLEWHGYPLESLPQSFCAKLLVEIHMPHSHVKRLWKGIQELDNLEGIDLSESKQLEELPDLSQASRLKWVNLSGCESLRVLHPSVLSSDTLVTLILDECKNLSSVKGYKHLKSLQKISVNGCSSLREFAVSSDLIENLDLSKTGIEALDTSIGRLCNLRWLNLEGLRLKHILKELSDLKSLKELRLSHIGLVIDKDQLHVLFGGLQSLQILHLKDCSNLFEFPDNIGTLSELHELRIDGSSVKSLPTSIKHLQELEILSLENCTELLSLPELPPLIKEFYANNCTSLMSVSNIRTFATKMIGKRKHISFKNSLKLNGRSLYSIIESLHLTMVSAAFHNVLVRRYSVGVHSYSYNRVEACLPGSRVPKEFTHRSKKSSSITINCPVLSNLLGFIYAVVLSPSQGLKKHGAEIKVHCLAGGTKATWGDKAVSELNSDHVYIWYDPFHCDIIRRSNEPKVSFEFNVTPDMGEVDASISIKECGVHVISVSELHRVLLELEVDSNERKDLENAFEVDLGHSITMMPESSYDRKVVTEGSKSMTAETNTRSKVLNCGPQLQCDTFAHKLTATQPHQHHNRSQRTASARIKAATSRIGLFFNLKKRKKFTPHRSQWQPHPQPQLQFETLTRSSDHFSDEEESMESTYGETMTGAGSSCKEDNRESRKDVKSEGNEGTSSESEVKGNEGTPSESDVELHLPVDAVAEENVSDMSVGNYYDQPNIVEETQIPKENEQMDLDKSEVQDESDEDPLAELESLLLGSSKSSQKAACSTSDVAVKEALHNLEFLLEQSLENILADVELQRQLQISLECIDLAPDEKVSPSVAELVKSMTSSIEDLFKNFALTQKAVEDHTCHLQQKDELVQQMKEAKKQKELLKEKMNQYKLQAKNFDKEAEDLDEKIRLLVEQIKMVQMEQTKLKVAMEGCDGEKKKLTDEAKNWVAETKELLSAIKNSEVSYNVAISKQEELNKTWEASYIACSTSDVVIREALHNLEWLIERSLENIHSDAELQQQLQISLECIEHASDENVSPSIAKLVKSMTSSIKDMLKKFALTQKVVKDHTSCLQQKEKLVQQMVNARKQQELLKEKTNQYKFQAESLEREVEDLDGRIQLLVEQKRMVQMKQTKLKEASEECHGEKKKLRDEAKNWVAESTELMLVIKNSEVSYAAAISKQENEVK